MNTEQQKVLLEKVKSFVQARSMQEHWQAYRVFDEAVRWDAPPILLNGREKLRVVAYFAKRVAKLDFTEHSVKDTSTASDEKQISIVCTFHFKPLPECFHLPSIHLNATIVLGVSDNLSTVTSIYGRLHSLPCLPNVIRRLNAFCLGTIGLATEALWSKTLWVYGDRSYQKKDAMH